MVSLIPESNRLPQRVFAPPVVKSYSTPFGKGELELHGKAEDGVTAKSINILPVQSKRQNERTSNVEKESQCKEDLEMIENVGGIMDFVSLSEISQARVSEQEKLQYWSFISPASP